MMSPVRFAPLDVGLYQPRQHLGRNSLTQGRVGFEETGDVGEVFLALAGAPCLVHHCPKLPLEDVIEVGHRKPQTQQLPDRCSLHERGVPEIGLDLNAKVRSGQRHIEAMGKAFDDERLAPQSFDLVKLVRRDGHIWVQ